MPLPEDDYCDFMVSLKSNGPFSKRLLSEYAHANMGDTITIDFEEAKSDEDDGVICISPAFARALAAHLIEQADEIEKFSERNKPTCQRCGEKNNYLISPGRKYLFWGCASCDAHARSMDSRPPGKGAIPEHECELWVGAEIEEMHRKDIERKAQVA